MAKVTFVNPDIKNLLIFQREVIVLRAMSDYFCAISMMAAMIVCLQNDDGYLFNYDGSLSRALDSMCFRGY